MIRPGVALWQLAGLIAVAMICAACSTEVAQVPAPAIAAPPSSDAAPSSIAPPSSVTAPSSDGAPSSNSSSVAGLRPLASATFEQTIDSDLELVGGTWTVNIGGMLERRSTSTDGGRCYLLFGNLRTEAVGSTERLLPQRSPFFAAITDVESDTQEMSRRGRFDCDTTELGLAGYGPLLEVNGLVGVDIAFYQALYIPPGRGVHALVPVEHPDETLRFSPDVVSEAPPANVERAVIDEQLLEPLDGATYQVVVHDALWDVELRQVVSVVSTDPQWQCFALLGSALLIEDVQNEGTHTFLPRWLPVVNGATRIDHEPFVPCDSGETEEFGYQSTDDLFENRPVVGERTWFAQMLVVEAGRPFDAVLDTSSERQQLFSFELGEAILPAEAR